MARYTSPLANLDVLGGNMNIFFNVMKEHTAVANRLLARHKVKDFGPTDWYSIQNYLDVFNEIEETIGGNTLFSIGKQIPTYAAWPPDIQDIESGLRSIDVAYHLNHRLEGKVMFDEKTGTLLEGIGHYTTRVEGKRRIVVVSDSIYPPEFDRGIVTAVARKFKPAAEVVRDPAAPSRLQGGTSCTFVVTW